MTEVEVQEIKAELISVRRELQRLAKEVSRVVPPERPSIRTGHPYVMRVEGICSGWPVIQGTRLTVQAVVEKIRLGQTPEEIVTSYPERLTLAHVHDALSYYYENPKEIEAQIAANKSALAQVSQLQTLRASDRERP